MSSINLISNFSVCFESVITPTMLDNNRELGLLDSQSFSHFQCQLSAHVANVNTNTLFSMTILGQYLLLLTVL